MQPTQETLAVSIDSEHEEAPPSSQPRPVEGGDEDTASDTSVVVEPTTTNGDAVASVASDSSSEGEFLYKNLTGEPSSDEEVEDDIDLELIEAEARRRLLAEELGGKGDNHSDSDSGSESDSEKEAPVAKPLQSQPMPVSVASPAKKLTKAEKMKQRLEKISKQPATSKDAVSSKQPTQQFTQALVDEVESVARGHAVWTVSKTKKEFNKALFPYLKERVNLSQGDALLLLNALRGKWEAELDEKRQEKKDSRAAARKPSADQRKASGKFVAASKKAVSAPEPAVTFEEKAEVIPAVQEDTVMAEVGISETADPPAPILKRKRDLSDVDPVVASEITTQTSNNSTPVISKTAAKKEAKRLRQLARVGDTPDQKLKLVGSEDWYKNDGEKPSVVDVPVMGITDPGLDPEKLVVDEKEAKDTKPARKRAKRGPTKSEHFSTINPSAAGGQQKGKASRADLIASLANDLLKDTPQLTANSIIEPTEEDADREPTFFSAGAPVTVNRGDIEKPKQAKPKKATQEPKQVLTKKQRRDQAAERNRERQLASNSAKDPVIDRTVIEPKKVEQSVSFLEMARKAKEAVKAAEGAHAMPVVENKKKIVKPKVENHRKPVAAPAAAGADGEEGKKRKRRRNNNRLSETDIKLSDNSVPVTDAVSEQPKVEEARQPLEAAVVNEQNTDAPTPKAKRNRKPRASKAAVAEVVEQSKEHHS